MRIEFICPKCKKSYFATEILWGKQIRCTKCSTLVDVPGIDFETLNKLFKTSKYVVFERKKLINILEELKALRKELGLTGESVEADYSEFAEQEEEPVVEEPPVAPKPQKPQSKLTAFLKSKQFWRFILWITVANIVLIALYFKFLRA